MRNFSSNNKFALYYLKGFEVRKSYIQTGADRKREKKVWSTDMYIHSILFLDT